MKISIFTEDSGTTREEIDVRFKKFYKGGFLSISNFVDQLEEFGEVQLHILSEQFGLIRGDDIVNNYMNRDFKDGQIRNEFLSEFLNCVSNSDVMIIVLSSSKFDSLVMDNWEQVSERVNPGSIWYIGATQNSLNAIDFDQFDRKGCELVTYEKVGVARINNESREEILKKIERYSSD